jgi:cellulose synthase/poly-beta-1,6-N-acetylglucosamine synthase-like glycosyltransferase
VPCYNEPPEMVKETLDALARLDYPDYEVLVIDNNTKDPAVWEPVQAYCETLGPRFRFFHVAPLAGFKGGALNYALERTAPDAEVVAVIDSDYCVSPNWLKHMVPHFADPKIAVVQSPQDYRDDKDSLFKKLCYAEYKGFFHIGMVTRNDRDAIIQHGTMTMTRKSVLDELKWAGWCITEDAELGLRVFQKGLSAAYFEDSYGKGLMPDTFIDFKKQRFRWAYGAIQIMKRHARSLLFGKDTALTRGQRYHFVAGWLPWIADGLNIFFTIGALLWSAAMIIVPQRVDPPLLIFAIPPLALFFFKLGKILFLYQRQVGVNLRDAFYAAVAGLALSHTIAKAVLYGFFTSSIPFFRTPKMKTNSGLLIALGEAREEVFVMLLLWGAAAGIAVVQGFPSPDVIFWVAVLLMQSLPYLAALIMALLSSVPKPQEVVEPAIA